MGGYLLLPIPTSKDLLISIDYISARTRRPLVTLSELQLNMSHGDMEQTMTRWFSLGEKWDAIFLIDNCDELFNYWLKEKGREAPQQGTILTSNIWHALGRG